ncbi:MAG: hypothetical protein H6619_02580 [Deltaproteobacteria bacterium]|nr:hypothetical protein [Deltaproteobacteria bacterium]
MKRTMLFFCFVLFLPCLSFAIISSEPTTCQYYKEIEVYNPSTGENETKYQAQGNSQTFENFECAGSCSEDSACVERKGVGFLFLFDSCKCRKVAPKVPGQGNGVKVKGTAPKPATAADLIERGISETLRAERELNKRSDVLEDAQLLISYAQELRAQLQQALEKAQWGEDVTAELEYFRSVPGLISEDDLSDC